jgi:hypothetical protein
VANVIGSKVSLSESNDCTKEITKHESRTVPKVNRFIVADYCDKLGELLFLILIKTLVEEIFPLTNENYTSIIINTPLLLKRGAASLH